MPYTITENLDDPRIIPFLSNNIDATIYHHPAWLKAIEKTFKHKANYLLLEDEDKRIAGLLPFVFWFSKITGNRIVSLPFSTHCIPLLPSDNIKKALSFLLDKYKVNVNIHIINNNMLELEGCSHTEDYITHILELKGSIEDIFLSLPLTSIRQRIKKTERDELSISLSTSESDVKIFYKFEVALRKKLLLPPLPFSFFLNVYQELKPFNFITIPIVKSKGINIAAGFIMNFKETYYLEYIASDNEYTKLHPNHKLIWEVIKLAKQNSASKLDFGRTALDNRSLIKFKENWNAKKYPLAHIVVPEVRNLNPRNTRLLRYLKMINRIMPKKLLELEGRLIYPHLG